jgi:hypothetical protein
MTLKRYQAIADTSITNIYEDNLLYSASLSNCGGADSLQLFSVNHMHPLNSGTSDNRQSRILVRFPLDQLMTDITASSEMRYAKYYLKLTNVPHPDSLPKEYYINVTAVSKSWSEGIGLDMDSFQDTDAANWISSSIGVQWDSEGGDYLTGTYLYSQYLTLGTESLNVDVTDLVKAWLSGTVPNYGFGVLLSSSHENATQSFYKKKFSARTSEFWYSRPILEAQWDDSIFDDRYTSYSDHAAIPAADKTNTIYLYNKIKGQLTNLPTIGTGSIYVSLYTNSLGLGTVTGPFTGGYVKTGIYSVSFSASLTGTVYDYWRDLAGTTTYYSSSIKMKNIFDDLYDEEDEFLIKINNIKNEYYETETPRFRIFTRPKNWQPNYYVVYQQVQDPIPLENLYWKIDRVIDNYSVVPYGTGSINYTKCSSDNQGNYFDFDMSLLEPEYVYQISFIHYWFGKYKELKDKFKFKVIENFEQSL